MRVQIKTKRRRASKSRTLQRWLGLAAVLMMYAAGHGAVIYFASWIGIYDGSFSESVRSWLLDVLPK